MEAGYRTPRSRWNLVKHTIVAIEALRLRSRRLARLSRSFPNLELKSIIDGSSSDKVYKVVDRITGETYTLKEFSRRLYDSAEVDDVRREIEVVKRMNHPNIMKCYQIFYVDFKIYLLFEPMDRGSLAGITVTSRFDLASFGRQVLLGLGYLHRNEIRHGDIKPSNIFVNHLGQVKVLYSGRILPETPVISTEIGGIHDGFSWDIWSVGLCILKLSKGLNWSSQQVPTSSQPSIELWRFLSCCMQTERGVAKRWTAEELSRHPFFLEQLSLKEKGGIELSKQSLSDASDEGGVELDESLSRASYERESEHVFASSSEVTTCYEEVEQISPRKKRTKTSAKNEDNIYDGESKDPGHHEHFQRCIEHCTLFLPDCEFEKDKLVQMWIAEGCIELELTKRMEDVANFYFDALLDDEVIIPSTFDNLYRRMKYKVNTVKASTWLLKWGNYVRMDAGNYVEICKEVLHLTWQCKKLDRSLFDALKNLKQLRTLVVIEDCSCLINQLPSDIFLGLKLLRTLDLSRTHISELPGSLGLLESLRYLDASETPIKGLPESMDRLSFLQTLKLKGCFAILALPRGLGRLVNLRHLDFDIVSQLKSMPRGMGNLVKLQTLQAFLVGKNDRRGIGELRNMNEITGSFCISMLENVSSAEEAKEAALGDKEHIDKLELRWHDHVNNDSQDTAEILECLQPHFRLKELQLTFYRGSKLPSWISNPSFTVLASITLYKCINCDILPSIGELPSLKILHIVEMNNLKNITPLFCRNHRTQGFSAFPRLEKLTLDSMLNLEEWTGIEDDDFPCLRHVSIRYCPKLYVLPSLSHLCSLQHLEISHCMQLISLPEGLLPGSLESLIIRGCPKINERCLKDRGLDRFKIAPVKNIWIDFEKISLD